MVRRLIEAPDLTKQSKTEISLPRETEFSIKNLSSALLAAKEVLDKFQSDLSLAQDIRSKIQELSSKIQGVSVKVNRVGFEVVSLSTRMDEKPDIPNDLLNLQKDIFDLNGKVGEIPLLKTKLRQLQATLVELDKIKKQLHNPGSDTSLGVQKQNLNMGGYNIINVRGSEVATREDIEGLGGFGGYIGGGGGYMAKVTYDPNAVGGDAFDVDNHVDGTTNKVYTATEKTKLDGIATGADVTGSNAPQAHAASHAVGGGDTILPADPGADKFLMWDDDPGELAWQAIAGGGDMLKATYDPNEDGVIALAQLDTGVMSEAEHAADGHTMAIDGRDVSVDGTKLDGIEASADVTDATNVAAAGALMVANLENPPTEDEANKAPTSEWAFDHDAAVDAHHAKYTDAEAKAAAVQSGAITDGVTLAPTHDAVYDVKVTADAAQPAATDDADAVAAVAAAGVAFAENKGITLDIALSADGQYNAIMMIAGTAGTNLAFGEFVYFAVADSKWEKAKGDAEATIAPMTGIVVVAGNENAAITVMLIGSVRADAAFPALTVGAPVFISAATAGAVTSTELTTGQYQKAIGWAVDANTIILTGNTDWVKVG